MFERNWIKHGIVKNNCVFNDKEFLKENIILRFETVFDIGSDEG